MFDDNHMDESDLLLGSILRNGEEEVPAHVWEGVAGGLDKAARRRSAVLWIGRATAVAAAAAIAVGVFIGHESEQMVEQKADDTMIALVESSPAKGDTAETAAEDVLMADVVKAQKPAADRFITSAYEMIADCSDVPQSTSGEETAEKAVGQTVSGTADYHKSAAEEPETFSQDFRWEENERKEKIKTSIVLSGIAGTNSPQSDGRIGPLRSPGVFSSPSRTTIEQTGAQTTYGIPLSFGVGVKLGFTKRWSLGMGLNYTLLTSRFNGKYTKVEDGMASLPISATISNSQHYIGIPLNAYYNIVSRDFINFYAYAGGAVEKCVSDRYTVQTTPVIHHSESVKGVQLSANAGIGVEFLIGRHVGLYIDPSLRYDFRCGQPKSIRTAQPLMLGFEMGFRFNL